MGKGISIGVSDKARVGKKGWIGIDGVARKIKKMWIGVGNVARLFFGGGIKVTYYKTATSLSEAKNEIVSASFGNYAVFFGGQNWDDDYLNSVDAYDTSLTRKTTYAYSYAPRPDNQLASVGGYLLYPVGYYLDSDLNDYYCYDVVRFSSTMTRSILSSDLSEARMGCGGATIGNYALFAGGVTEYVNFSDTVDYVNSSMTVGKAPNLHFARRYLRGCTIGNYALFAGGFKFGSSDGGEGIDAYNTSLTRSTPPLLTAYTQYPCVVTVGNKALVFKTSFGKDEVASADVYDTSLTKTTISNFMNLGRTEFGYTTVNNVLLIAGGYTRSSSFEYHNTLLACDESLSLSLVEPTLSTVCRYDGMGGASVGNYALFAGGTLYNRYGSSASAVVDAFAIEK